MAMRKVISESKVNSVLGEPLDSDAQEILDLFHSLRQKHSNRKNVSSTVALSTDFKKKIKPPQVSFQSHRDKGQKAGHIFFLFLFNFEQWQPMTYTPHCLEHGSTVVAGGGALYFAHNPYNTVGVKHSELLQSRCDRVTSSTAKTRFINPRSKRQAEGSCSQFTAAVGEKPWVVCRVSQVQLSFQGSGALQPLLPNTVLN